MIFIWITLGLITLCGSIWAVIKAMNALERYHGLGNTPPTSNYAFEPEPIPARHSFWPVITYGLASAALFVVCATSVTRVVSALGWT